MGGGLGYVISSFQIGMESQFTNMARINSEAMWRICVPMIGVVKRVELDEISEGFEKRKSLSWAKGHLSSKRNPDCTSRYCGSTVLSKQNRI
jgi:hypothetical protein